MKDNILTLLILAIIASKFIMGYSFVIMGLIIAAVSVIFNMIPEHRIYKRLEKKILQFLQQGPLSLNPQIKLVATGSRVEDILVYYNREKVGNLMEFESAFPNSYKNFLHCIEEKMDQPVVEKELVEETSQFNSYISLIDNYNIDIVDEEISLGLYHTSNQLKYLQHLLDEHPKTNSKITKLENYYLPILMDILENYTKVLKTDQQAVVTLRTRCQKSIVLINEALKNIIQSLYEDEKMNLSADMSVLENLLKKDGLVQDDLNAKVMEEE